MTSNSRDRTAVPAAIEHCEAMAAAHPEVSQVYTQMSEYIRDKLWHQLTVVLLEQLSSAESAETSIQAAELYDKVVLAVDSKLHPLSVARMAVLTAHQLVASQNDLPAAKAVIENCLEKLTTTSSTSNNNSNNNNTNNRPSDIEATIYLQSKHAMLTLQELLKESGFSVATASTETKAALDTVAETILQTNAPIIQELSSVEVKTDTDSAMVHAAHYETAMTYYKLLGPAEAFYEQAMQYLNYVVEMPDIQLAVDLCLAALTGDGVYNLTAVEQAPVTQQLATGSDTTYAWLLELLKAVAAGDVLLFQQLSQHHAAAIQGQPALVHRAAAVQEKLTLTALVLAVLAKDSHERCLSFTDLQTVLHLNSVDQVEWVLMRAFSVNLLHGSMDQCAGTVNITWVQPRVLSAPQMTNLASKFGEWAVSVHQTKELVSEQTSSSLLA